MTKQSTKTSSCRLLKFSAAALIALATLVPLASSNAAEAQNTAQFSAGLPLSPEGSWLYTVTIPGTPSRGSRHTPLEEGTRKPTSYPSTPSPWRAPVTARGR